MKRTSRRLVTSASLFLFSVLAGSAQTPAVTYTVSMPAPWTHLFEVTATCGAQGDGDSLDFILPVWRTGRYVIFDFAGGVEQFSATDRNSTALPWRKIDKTTWRVWPARPGPVVVRYEVFADEFLQRTRGLDDMHGFIDGTSVFMYVPRYRFQPCLLVVRPFGNWHVTTGLDSVPGKRWTYAAPTYDYLVDCPLEIGTQRDFTFRVGGIPHVLSLYGPIMCDVDTMIGMISRVIRMDSAFWGGLPYARYVFIVHAYPEGGGGTEHINSEVLDVRSIFSPRPDSVRRLLGLVAHEFFHTWNVKRLRPRGMDPYDWTRENYYRELWIAEGTTSYLPSLLLVRDGLRPLRQYLENLATMARTDRMRPGNEVQSVTSSSFDAWIKYWRGNEEAYNFESDYYGRGAAVSLILDLELREVTANSHSLDDLLRLLYHRFPLGSGGYTVANVESAASELAGRSMAAFFGKYVYGTDPLPWDTALGYAGLALVSRDSTAGPWLGITSSETDGRVIVRQVVAGSPAYTAGLNVGDQVLALNGYRVGAAGLAARVKEMQSGDRVRLTVFRNDTLREFAVTLTNQPVPLYTVQPVDAPSPLQESIFTSWLGHAWDEAR